MVMFNIIQLASQFKFSLAAVSSSAPPWWYLTRTMAVAAYCTLTASVLFGIIQSIARQSRQRISWMVDDVHQFIALLAGVLVIGHLFTLKMDSYYAFTITNFLLPGAQPYKIFATNLGVWGIYGMALLLITSWLRQRIPHSMWRFIHYASFLTFFIVTAHGFLAGSDNGEPWMRAMYAGAGAAVLFLLIMRIVGRGPTVQQEV